MAEFRLFAPGDLKSVVGLCAAEGWPSFPEDPGRALRALTAPGVTTVVAVEAGRVIGFAQLQSDGEIQAHLSLIAVDPAARRQGIARRMLDLALRTAGGLRIDLNTDGADAFYAAFRHFRMTGFRLYPPFVGDP
ncbi:MAG: GNAT family N-acetyltransferase [Caulobacterales bacterium]